MGDFVYGSGGSCNKMFDFLKNLSHSHNHQPPPQVVEEQPFEELSSDEEQPPFSQQLGNSKVESVISKGTKPVKIRQPRPRPKPKEINSIVGKMQQGVSATLEPEVKGFLDQMLQESRNGIKNLLLNRVEKATREKEGKVYVREMSQNEDEYLWAAIDRVKPANNYLNSQLSSLVGDVIDKLGSDLESERYHLHMQHKRPNQGNQHNLDTLRLIRQREQELQDKIGELTVELEGGREDWVEQRTKQITSIDEFDPDSVKTRKAEEYIRQKQRQREEKEQRLQEMKERRRQQEMDLKEYEKQRAEQVKKDRHERLKEEFDRKRQEKLEREEKARSEQLHFKEFLKEYNIRKPLFQKKEEEFRKKELQEKKQRFRRLEEQQAKYQPIDLQTLEMHSDHYEELKREDRERKRAEMQLAREEERLRETELKKKAHQGKFRYLILNEMVEAQTQREQKAAEKEAILAKKRAYSIEVKEMHRPKIDPGKRAEMEQMINSARRQPRKHHTPNRVAYSENFSTIGGSVYDSYSEPEVDPKVEGRKYHRLFKAYIRDKISQGEIKKQSETKTEPKPQKRPDYLKELREKYGQLIPSRTRRLQRQIGGLQQGQDYSSLMIKASDFEEKAKRRELKLKYAAHGPEEERRLQQEYLCAVKAKVELVNHMN